MKLFTFLFLLLAITYKCSGQQCGINTAGVLIQQLTTDPITSAEGLFYDVDANKLYFVDRYNPTLGVIDGKTAAVHYTPIPDVKYISSVIPIKNMKNTMVGLADNKFILLHLQRDSARNIIKITTQDIEVIEDDSEYAILASIVDKKGRIWIDLGTDCKSLDAIGKMIQIQKDNSIKEIIDGMGIPSGMGFSPDYTMFYQVDAKANVVYKYDCNLNTGSISNPTVIYNLTAEIYFKGHICSIKVAKDNTLWLGICGSGVIIKYNWQKKQYEQVHNCPAEYPVYLELGGPNLDVLFVGSTTGDAKTLAAGGAVFAISGTGTKGLPSCKVAMPSTVAAKSKPKSKLV